MPELREPGHPDLGLKSIFQRSESGYPQWQPCTVFFLSFNRVVISLLYESLMLVWLNAMQSVAGQWFGVVSKWVVCGNALASPNRNACLLSTDCIICKTTGGQNAHLTKFKTIVTIEGGEMSSQSEPGL